MTDNHNDNDVGPELEWDYKTIEEQIPELVERDLKNNRVKKISSKLADVLIAMSKTMKTEVKIIESNRSHLLYMNKQQLEKIEPEILAEAFQVVSTSILNAVKGHKPTYQKFLQLVADKEINQKKLEESEVRFSLEKREVESLLKESQVSQSTLMKMLKEKDSRIKELEKEIESQRNHILKYERDIEHSRAVRNGGGIELSRSLSRPQSGFGIIASSDFQDMKKLIASEKADLAMISSKNKQLNTMKISAKKKDQQIVKGRYR